MDQHDGGAGTPGVDVMQPLAVDRHELAARRHRGFDFPRGVGSEKDQPRNDQGNDQNQRQQDAHVALQ